MRFGVIDGHVILINKIYTSYQCRPTVLASIRNTIYKLIEAMLIFTHSKATLCVRVCVNAHQS